MEANNIIVLAVIVVMLLHLASDCHYLLFWDLGSLALIILCDVYSLSVFGEVPLVQ